MKHFMMVVLAGMLTASFGFAQANDLGANARFRMKFGRSAQVAAQATTQQEASAKEEAGMAGMKCMQNGGMKGMAGMKGMSGMASKMAMPADQDAAQDTAAKPAQAPAGHVHSAAAGTAEASAGCCGTGCCKHGE